MSGVPFGAEEGQREDAGSRSELSWLLDSLADRVGQVRHAVVLSNDGLRIAATQGLPRDDAERMAAVAASFQSLARGAGREFGGGAPRQTIVELESAFLFVTAAGPGACLAVLAGADADVGMIAYEMAMLVVRVGRHLSAGPRTTLADHHG